MRPARDWWSNSSPITKLADCVEEEPKDEREERMMKVEDAWEEREAEEPRRGGEQAESGGEEEQEIEEEGDHGSHMRSARGQRKTWRAARQAAEQVADESWVGETRRGDGGGDRWERRKERQGETQQQQQQQQRSRNATTNATNMIMKEHIRSNRVAIEIVFQPFHPATDASLHDERVTAVRRSPSCISSSACETSQSVCSDSWKVPVDAFAKSCPEEPAVAKTPEQGLTCYWVGFLFVFQ